MELSFEDGKRLLEGVASEASREGPVEMCDSTRTGRIIGAKQGMTSPIRMLARARDGHRFLLFASLSLLLLFHLVRAPAPVPTNSGDKISHMGSDMPGTGEPSNGERDENLRPGLSESGNSSPNPEKLKGLSSTADVDGAQVGEAAKVDPEDVDLEHNIIWRHGFPEIIISREVTVRPLEKYYFRCPKGLGILDIQVCYIPFSLTEGCPQEHKISSTVQKNLFGFEEVKDRDGDPDWPIVAAQIKEPPNKPFDLYGMCVTDDQKMGWSIHFSFPAEKSTVPPASGSAGTGGNGDDEGDVERENLEKADSGGTQAEPATAEPEKKEEKKVPTLSNLINNFSRFVGGKGAGTHETKAEKPKPEKPTPAKPTPAKPTPAKREKKNDKRHDFIWKDSFPNEVLSRDVTIRPFEKLYIRCPRGVDHKNINVCLSPLANVTDPCPEDKKVGDWSSVLPGWEKLKDEEGKDWPTMVAQINQAPEDRVDLFVVCVSESQKKGWSLHLSFPAKVKVPYSLNSTVDTIESEGSGGSGSDGKGGGGAGGGGAGGGKPSGAHKYGLALGLVVVCALTTLFLSS